MFSFTKESSFGEKISSKSFITCVNMFIKLKAVWVLSDKPVPHILDPFLSGDKLIKFCSLFFSLTFQYDK